MKVRVDPDLCCGCGICVDLCPEVLEYDSDGKAIAKVTNVPKEQEKTCQEAADACPTGAILIE